MTDIFLFAGTIDGRKIAEKLHEKKIPSIVFVATEYGSRLLEESPTLTLRSGRLSGEQMAQEMLLHKPKLVIDATHPYAEAASREIVSACEKSGTSYLRVERESHQIEDAIYFSSLDEMVRRLNEGDEIVFSTLGAKSVEKLSHVRGFQERMWVRVLPMFESLKTCSQAGLSADRIICMQGPFSEEINVAFFRETKAEILLTKDSGYAGGWSEKINAAKKCGMKIYVLSRPGKTPGISLEEMIKRIETW